VCYQAEKLLADFGDKLTAEMRGSIETTQRETREACTRRDAKLAVERSGQLKKLLKDAGAVIYAQSGGGGVYQERPGPSTSDPRPGGRVVDAQYKESR